MHNYIQAGILLLFFNYDDWVTIQFDRNFGKGRDEMKNECLQFDLSGMKITFMDGTEIPDSTPIIINGGIVKYSDISVGKCLGVVPDKESFVVSIKMGGMGQWE